ncbi:MAG: Cpe/LpqF family protein [Yaniella sp.]|nr:Cpe/LpqF family protein [Yaniella sp.]
MKMPSGARRSMLGLIFTASAALAMTACSSGDAPAGSSSDSPNSSQDSTAADSVDIPGDTPVGEESQRIVDILNAKEDSTVDDWGSRLHASFTAEVSPEEIVELINQNIRPAQPFTVTNYEGGERQAVTTLTSPASAPLDMSVTLDSDGLVTGLFFGESSPPG